MRTLNVRVLLIVSVVLCTTTGIFTFSAYREKYRTQEQLNIGHRIIRETVALMGELRNAETSQRGFIITADSNYISEYRRATTAAWGHYNVLRNAGLERSQDELLDQHVRRLIARRLARTDETIRRYHLIGKNEAERIIREGVGKAMMDSLEIYLDRLTSHHQALVNSDRALLTSLNEATQWFVYGSLLLIAFTSILGIVTIDRWRKRNLALIHSMEALNANLEKKVEQQVNELRLKNEELASGNKALEEKNSELVASQESIQASLEYISDLQRTLEASEKKYRLLSENSEDMIAVFNLDNKFEYVSPSCRTLLGYEPEELIGIDGKTLVHPDDVARLNPPLEQSHFGDVMLNPYFRLRKKNGSYIWVETISKPLLDENGKITAIQTANRDITRRRETELALQAEKTRAEEATRAKTAFLSMMSHEIRTPLNAIIGLATLLLENKHLPAQAEALRLLKFSGENLLLIINEILDFTKIEAGKLSIEAVDIDLHALLSDLTSLFRQRASEKGIILLFNYDKNVPRFVRSDHVRLGQIITNLLGNAIKFTEKGTVALEVRLAGTDEHGNSRIIFTVRDTGIGIEEGMQQAIFESFTQASSETTRRFGGTGLGLSITKRLLQLMGSDISVQSKPGQGSAFSFVLDLPKAVSEVDARRPTQATKQTFSRELVLLAEDNRVNQIVATSFLHKWGLDVILANDGKEAVKLLSENTSVRLVLMDLQMPEMDGFEATRSIRDMKDPFFQNVPIVALSAGVMADFRDKAIACGMNDFVTKPFQPDELYNTIRKYIPVVDIDLQDSRLERLDLYSDGDPDFRRELASLIVKNIQELRASLAASLELVDPELFSRTAHKVKTSISMLGDVYYGELVDEIKGTLKDPRRVKEIQAKIDEFFSLSDRICGSLEEELRST